MEEDIHWGLETESNRVRARWLSLQSHSTSNLEAETKKLLSVMENYLSVPEE